MINEKMTTDHIEREVQNPVDSEEGLHPDNINSVWSSHLHTINNKFEHDFLDEAVRLRNAHPIRQSRDAHVPDHKNSSPGLTETTFLVHKSWAIYFILRRWISNGEMPGILVTDIMGLRTAFTLVAVAHLWKIVTDKVVMGSAMSILWQNTLEE